MLKQYRKSHSALILCFLFAGSEYTLHGMDSLLTVANGRKIIKNKFNTIQAYCDSYIYQQEAGILRSTIAQPSTIVFIPAAILILYNNPTLIGNFLNTNLATVANSVAHATPRGLMQSISQLNIINKNCAIIGLEKVTQTVLTYPIKSLKQKEDPTVWNTAIYLNPLNRFTNTDSHKYNNKLLSDFITLASIFYACYSAWYTNPTSQLSSVAETLFLQICIRYALHVAALPRVPKEKVKKFLGIGNKNEGVD